MTRLQLWFGTACAALVLLSSTAIGNALAIATVSAGAASGTISTTTTSVTVPVTISRPDNTALFGFSVNFTVSSPLTLPAGNSSITLGPFLGATGATPTFQVINHGGGNYTADGVTLGPPCGSTALSGTLFNIALASSAPSGSGTVTITSVSLRDCNNAPLASAIGTAATVNIDNTLPVTAVTSPNGGEFWVAGSTHNITWTATDNDAIAATGIDLELSTNNGGSWSPIASGLANSGSFAWLVPNTLTTSALVRVTARDVNGNSAQDASNAVFTIAGATTTSVSSSVNPSLYGQAVSFTATVAPVAATGTVQFKVDGGNFGSPVAVVAGSASSGSTSTLSVGTHTVTAEYSGDASYAASSGSLGGGQVVNQAATTTALVVDVNPSVFLDPITLTATVTANPPGGGTPGGTVTFYDGLNPIGSDPLDAFGVAEIVVSSLPVGTQSLTAVYGGSASHTGSTSSLVAHEVKAKIVATAGPNGSINPPGTTLYSLNATPAYTFAANAGYHVLSVTVDGGAVAITSPYTFAPVSANHTIDVQFEVNPAVPAISSLVATPMRTGNDNSGITRVRLTWDPVPGGSTVELFRASYGNYPEYDDGPSAGSVPSVPSDPPLAPWVSIGVRTSAYFDLPATRDFYYYVAIVTDGYGTHSPVSNMTTGTLDYALGDVSNGVTAGQGNNLVNTADLSLLGVAYGNTLTLNGPFNYLDIGPTTNFSFDARPTTDNVVNFEDLVMLALNYGTVFGVAAPVTHAPALQDAVALEAPQAVAPGNEVSARLNATGTGRVHALSAVLSWDAAVVEPTGQGAAAFFVEQNGVALSPRPGSIDLAILGSDADGLTGEGQIASLSFKVLKAGNPRLRLAKVVARDGANQPVLVLDTSPVDEVATPLVTGIGWASPNPFPGTTSLTFTMAKRGEVRLAIYSLTGRHVVTLAHGVREPGAYRLAWDGRDASGALAPAGVYYAQFTTEGVRATRKLTYLR